MEYGSLYCFVGHIPAQPGKKINIKYENSYDLINKASGKYTIYHEKKYHECKIEMVHQQDKNKHGRNAAAVNE